MVKGMTAEQDVAWRKFELKKAQEHYVVKQHVSHQLAYSSEHIEYVEAENGSGSRYVVVVTPLPVGHKEGGPVLVTLIWPWQTAWPMHWDSDVHASYIAEKFRCEHREQWSIADLDGVTRTIGAALGRPVTIDVE